MEEIWKDIAGYEGYYQVSNLGRVRSLDRYVATVGNKSGQRLVRGRIIKQTARYTNDVLGYYCVNLSKKGTDKLYTVHRLVATAFIPNPDNLPCVNHKDECKFNNRSDNLEWCTIGYNNSYGTARERSSQKTRMPVLKFDLSGNKICRYDSLKDAANIEGISKGNIANVCVNRNGKKSLNGFIFMYEEDYINNGFIGYKNNKKRSVNQYTIDDKFIKTFDSAKEAYESVGKSVKNGASNITAVCNGRQKTAYGFKWKYADEC